EETADLYTEAEPAAITYLKKSVKLIAETEPREQFISLPVVRVRRTGTGGFELDENFVAPSMAINASAVLYQRLRRLLDAL
ncbi:type VI secretion system baseplate subunit TssK, partial [Klebsiella pneumoniae]